MSAIRSSKSRTVSSSRWQFHLTLPFDRTNIKPGDRICVAVSGGADSVALLLTLHAANSAKRDSLGVGLIAVHVNHNLRGEESDADQQFVEDLCISLDIPLHLHQANVPARIAETRAEATPRPSKKPPATSATTSSPPSSPPATPTASSPPTPSTTRPKPSS